MADQVLPEAYAEQLAASIKAQARAADETHLGERLLAMVSHLHLVGQMDRELDAMKANPQAWAEFSKPDFVPAPGSKIADLTAKMDAVSPDIAKLGAAMEAYAIKLGAPGSLTADSAEARQVIQEAQTPTNLRNEIRIREVTPGGQEIPPPHPSHVAKLAAQDAATEKAGGLAVA